MKFEIKNEVEGATSIWLEKDGDDVAVMASNPKVYEGEAFYLIDFKPDGTINFNAGIPEELGFEVDKNGELLIEED